MVTERPEGVVLARDPAKPPVYRNGFRLLAVIFTVGFLGIGVVALSRLPVWGVVPVVGGIWLLFMWLASARAQSDWSFTISEAGVRMQRARAFALRPKNGFYPRASFESFAVLTMEARGTYTRFSLYDGSHHRIAQADNIQPDVGTDDDFKKVMARFGIPDLVEIRKRQSAG